MSQQAVEQTLGRILTDADFRRRFFADPPRAALHAGLTLSPIELDALRWLSEGEMARLGRRLDDRICRLCVGTEEENGDHPLGGT